MEAQQTEQTPAEGPAPAPEEKGTEESDGLMTGTNSFQHGPPRAYATPDQQSVSIYRKMREFRFWARMCALWVVCLAYVIGAIICFADKKGPIGVGIVVLLIAVPIFVVEGHFFSCLIPSVRLRRIVTSYYTRAGCYVVLSVPGFFYVGTIAGSVFLVISGILFLVAAIRKEGAQEGSTVDFSGIV
eukprot:GAFH01003887.1.p2 GENE.GAFH01003887.1~~GAFH01003887.1.p2  ORF type:complete len:216 (-),score=55.61 GAFH01003887.1:224-781(-)